MSTKLDQILGFLEKAGRFIAITGGAITATTTLVETVKAGNSQLPWVKRRAAVEQELADESQRISDEGQRKINAINDDADQTIADMETLARFSPAIETLVHRAVTEALKNSRVNHTPQWPSDTQVEYTPH